MAKLDMLIKEYGVSHQNPTNKLIHKICVPAIMMSIIGLLMCVGFLGINLAQIVIVLASIYYFQLSKKYFSMMLVMMIVMYLVNSFIAGHISLLWFSVVVFVISWIFQFIGHKIEGKKPSFLEDLSFLLIGPIWVAKAIIDK